MLPLTGVKVVELANNIAGPYAGFILAMLGAEVLKIERPESGDDARAWGPPFWKDTSATFHALNVNKQGATVDLKSPEQVSWLENYVEGCDVFIHNLRPGVLDELGLGAKTLRARNPRLVYCSLSAFGPEGPWRDKPGVDMLVQAMGGLMAVMGEPDGPPVLCGAPVLDTIGALMAGQGILTALLHRERTGQGQRVRTSLARATTAAQVGEFTRYAGRPAPLLGGWDFPGPGPDGGEQAYGCAPGQDGEWSFAERGHRVPVERFGLVNAPVVAANGLLVTHDHPEFGQLLAPGQLVVGAGPPPSRGPLLDEHRAEVLAELEAGTSP
jgi:crotonobetainyl-CoA:carnitine CoA-transferase CaiB-like acyl-CoA transferase